MCTQQIEVEVDDAKASIFLHGDGRRGACLALRDYNMVVHRKLTQEYHTLQKLAACVDRQTTSSSLI
jgi:hypothetical protein